MPKKTSSTILTYQTLSRRLDELVAKLRDPDAAIDDAVASYEEAMSVVAELEKYLETAENRIRKIKITAKVAQG